MHNNNGMGSNDILNSFQLCLWRNNESCKPISSTQLPKCCMEPDDTWCSVLHQQVQINPKSCATQQNYGGNSTTRHLVADDGDNCSVLFDLTACNVQFAAIPSIVITGRCLIGTIPLCYINIAVYWSVYEHNKRIVVFVDWPIYYCTGCWVLWWRNFGPSVRNMRLAHVLTAEENCKN
jgi:hypothetical protein